MSSAEGFRQNTLREVSHPRLGFFCLHFNGVGEKEILVDLADDFFLSSQIRIADINRLKIFIKDPFLTRGQLNEIINYFTSTSTTKI
ncbi:hypothetical protein ACQ902_001633 [Vibrio mimicus]